MSELVVGDFVLKLAVTIEIIIAGNIPCVEDILKEDGQDRASGSCGTRKTGFFSTITFHLFVCPLFLHLLTVLSSSAPLFNQLPSAYSAILILDLFVSCNSHNNYLQTEADCGER